MPDEATITFERAMDGGATTRDALIAAAQPVDTAPAAPAAPDPFAKFLEGVDPALHALVRPALERANKEWAEGVRPAFESAKRLEDLHSALRMNPRGALAYLGEHFNTKVRFADDTDPSSPPPGRERRVEAPPVDDYEATRAALKEQARTAVASQNFDGLWDATDRLTKLEAGRIAAERVGDLERTQASMQERLALDDLSGKFPDVDVKSLWPQIRQRQAAIRQRPHLFADEAFYIETGPHLVRELRRLKGQGVRAAGTEADKAAATVAGPSASAPTGAFDPYGLTEDQLIALAGIKRGDQH